MIRRYPRVLWRSTSRGPILLAPGQATPTLVSGAGAIVWELLDEPMEPEQLDAAIRAELDGAEIDLADAIATLHELGVLDDG